MRTFEPLDRPAWLPESVWPWSTGTLTTRAGRLAVTDAGTGPVLLLVHTGLGSLVWRDLLHRLVPHYRCVTLDAPGTGRSYQPAPTASRSTPRPPRFVPSWTTSTYTTSR
jgi:pimeloyl-ACP methyl ester carboxylesterase